MTTRAHFLTILFWLGTMIVSFAIGWLGNGYHDRGANEAELITAGNLEVESAAFNSQHWMLVPVPTDNEEESMPAQTPAPLAQGL